MSSVVPIFLLFVALASTALANVITADNHHEHKLKNVDGFALLGSYNFFGANGESLVSTYYLSDKTEKWNEAMAACPNMGLGKLVSIETAEEDETIKNFLSKPGGIFTIWTSGSFGDGMRWKWDSTSEIMEYTNWIGSPNYASTYRANIYKSEVTGTVSYGWFTEVRIAYKQYLCEITTAS